ncbi:MAG: flagellar hook protein FlgE [Chthonomonadales bacterium]|nr:flagellar hook protein FlgE [Chthonomonadales bacterium]
MLQAMFSGVSGLQAHQLKMSVIGNNIANVNTYGFKSGRVSFQDQLAQMLRPATAPSDTAGGLNPAQVGLGVSLGSIDTIETQGNLQTTGKGSDLAIQGSGFFAVTDGSAVEYTRDGSFDLDSTGAIVNQSTGRRLLGYAADASGHVDTGVPITAASVLTVPIGQLGSARATERIHFVGNLDAAAAVHSTAVTYSGNLSSAAAADDSVSVTSTVYDTLGNPHEVQVTLSNPASGPAGAGVPAGASYAWDATVAIDGTESYQSSAGKSRLYLVAGRWQLADATGQPAGSSIALDGGAGANHGPRIPGAGGAGPVSIRLDLGGATAVAGASSLAGEADGSTGTNPAWGTSIRTFDSLGIEHLIAFRYTRVPLEGAPPPGATSQWNWVATENGQEVASSATAGNSPLFFNPAGQIVAGSSQTAVISPSGQAVPPFTVSLDYQDLTQRAGDANAAATYQDGYAAGALNSFTISSDGVVTAVYSNGQSRALGQVAMAAFANPGGLAKVGNNLLRETSNSGVPQIGVPDQSGRGKIVPGFLEMSNVDLSGEFTNLIVTERGFQANTRIISVVDDLLQEVINLKR